MKQFLRGRKLFGGPVVGNLAAVHQPEAGSILVALKLTPSVVRALTPDHTAVLTCRGGFACHGANVLRVARRDRVKDITWITDLPHRIMAISSGTHCEILCDGTVVIAWHDLIAMDESEPVSELVGLFPSGSRIRCYWPDRIHDKFTASIMVPGLTEDIRVLGFDAEALYGPDRLIWFRGNTPTSGELLEYAQFTTELSKSTMDRQLNLYSTLVRRLEAYDRTDGDLIDLVEMARSYFSCFILHHRTYSHVLSTVIGIHLQGKLSVQPTIERLLCTELVRWYHSLPFPLSVYKDFVEEPRLIPLPPFSPEQEMKRTEDAVAADVDEMDLSLRGREILSSVARLCVLKEWKFVLNKLIASRMSSKLRRLPINAECVRIRTVEEVLEAYYAS